VQAVYPKDGGSIETSTAALASITEWKT